MLAVYSVNTLSLSLSLSHYFKTMESSLLSLMRKFLRFIRLNVKFRVVDHHLKQKLVQAVLVPGRRYRGIVIKGIKGELVTMRKKPQMKLKETLTRSTARTRKAVKVTCRRIRVV